jgi:hypothetical protein
MKHLAVSHSDLSRYRSIMLHLFKQSILLNKNHIDYEVCFLGPPQRKPHLCTPFYR